MTTCDAEFESKGFADETDDHSQVDNPRNDPELEKKRADASCLQSPNRPKENLPEGTEIYPDRPKDHGLYEPVQHPWLRECQNGLTYDGHHLIL